MKSKSKLLITLILFSLLSIKINCNEKPYCPIIPKTTHPTDYHQDRIKNALNTLTSQNYQHPSEKEVTVRKRYNSLGEVVPAIFFSREELIQGLTTLDQLRKRNPEDHNPDQIEMVTNTFLLLYEASMNMS